MCWALGPLDGQKGAQNLLFQRYDCLGGSIYSHVTCFKRTEKPDRVAAGPSRLSSPTNCSAMKLLLFIFTHTASYKVDDAYAGHVAYQHQPDLCSLECCKRWRAPLQNETKCSTRSWSRGRKTE